jgi:hypothetical protein
MVGLATARSQTQELAEMNHDWRDKPVASTGRTDGVLSRKHKWINHRAGCLLFRCQLKQVGMK